MSSTPGHHQRYECIGDVRLLHKRPDGTLTGVLLAINTGEPVEIAVLADRWPPQIAVGTRLFVKGTVQRETVEHRKNSNFILATQVQVVPRRQLAS